MKITKDITFNMLINDKGKREMFLKFLSQFCYKCETCENIASLSIKDEIGKLSLKCHCSSGSKYISLKNFLKNATINPEKQIFCENHKEIHATKFIEEERKYLCDVCINNLLAKNDDSQKGINNMIFNENEEEKENYKKYNIESEIKNDKVCKTNIENKIGKKDEKMINNNNENKEEILSNKLLKKTNEFKFYFFISFIILIVGIVIGIGIGILYYFPKQNKDVNNENTSSLGSNNDDYFREDENDDLLKDEKEDDYLRDDENDDLYDKVVVGIDFGSSYSGFAYSLKNNKVIESQDTFIHQTEIILEKNTNKLYKFGSQAHNELYTRNSSYAYFTKMKTELDPGLKKNTKEEYTIKAEYPKNYTVSLKIVIKEFLEAMANTAINKLNLRSTSKN